MHKSYYCHNVEKVIAMTRLFKNKSDHGEYHHVTIVCAYITKTKLGIHKKLLKITGKEKFENKLEIQM